MKQIVVLSGKGGTGKTFVSASLAWLAENAVIADCDVDASNLHLLLHPTIVRAHAFSGGSTARIAPDVCTGCEACVGACRFGAISMRSGSGPAVAVVHELSCEGCGVCRAVCPVDAPSFAPSESGRWFESTTSRGPMVHAHLFPGEDNSGKLVAIVRRAAKQHAEADAAAWTIIDGPPGTGCAAKSAVTGADFALLVTEPTVSGIRDLGRTMDLLDFFGVPGGVVVNKSTIRPETADRIKALAAERGMLHLGDIPFSRRVAETVAALEPYPAARDDDITERLRRVWRRLECELAGV